MLIHHLFAFRTIQTLSAGLMPLLKVGLPVNLFQVSAAKSVRALLYCWSCVASRTRTWVEGSGCFIDTVRLTICISRHDTHHPVQSRQTLMPRYKTGSVPDLLLNAFLLHDVQSDVG